MAKRFRVYLFRHGQTTFNRDGKFTGWMNPRLTQKGKIQALNIAKKLEKKKFEVAIHTSLYRSKETLAPVLQGHPECKIILEDDRMIERNYGELDGEKHESFIHKIGKQEYNLEIYGDSAVSLNNKNRKKIEEFFGEKEYIAIHRGYNIAAPGGESFSDVEKRVNVFIKKLKIFMRKNNFNVAISAHGNSIRLFRKIMENASREEAIKWVIEYDKIYSYLI